VNGSDDKSSFRIEPDPPVAGQGAKITYTGPSKEIEIWVDGRLIATKRTDKGGKIPLDPVPAGHEMILWDKIGYPGFLEKDIVDTQE